jgi:hypothetical protein
MRLCLPHENHDRVPRGAVFGPRYSHRLEQGDEGFTNFPSDAVVAYITRLRQSIDFTAVTQRHDDKLTAFNDEWKQKFAEGDTGGKWGRLYIILRRMIHSSSTLYRILVRFQEFFASFVRVRLASSAIQGS